MVIVRVATLSLFALALAGCAVGRDYSAPEPIGADLWAGAYAEEGGVPQFWWSLLDDPTLAQLLDDAVDHNRDIGIALTRVEEARASRLAARAAFWPSVNASGSYTAFEQSIESPGAGGTLIDAGLIERDVDFFNTGLDVSWELDLFGGVRRRNEAASARRDGVVAEQAGVVLSVLAETASAYFELRGAEERRDIAARNIASLERTHELTRRKVEAGLARRVDELRARAQLDAARARVPGLRATEVASRYRLAVLTGRPPEAIRIEPVVDFAVSVPARLPVGLRAEILRRRPDVVAAERGLAAATADLGVARADFFPRLVLNGNYGFEAEEADQIGSGRARTTALVPFVSWPVFQGGRLRANLEGADARARAALLRYEQAVLVALADAETALAAYAEEWSTLESLQAAAAASTEAASLSQRLYEQGLADFLTVLDAERRRDESVDARAQSQTRLLINLARVYKALGGGWGQTPPS